MITVEEAWRIIGENIKPVSAVEKVPLAQAAGRVLARDAVLDIDIPPFDRATMDGYAVLSSDGPGSCEVLEYVPAGEHPRKRVTSGFVTRIMTGAPVPEGADAVIPVERTDGFADVGEKARIIEAARPGQNISPKGEDAREGDMVLRAGALIGAPEAAVLAAAGVDPAPVYRLPSVAILSTGDELVPPAQKPGPGQIRNSNAISLAAQVKSLGIEPFDLGVARDDENEILDRIREGVKSDFLIVSGGVSAGDRDFVIPALERAGVRVLFRKIRIKPGKPTVFGLTEAGGCVFGMPGNPVSSTVIFELFVRPAIKKFMGLPFSRGFEASATLTGSVRRNRTEREEYIPVRLEWKNGAFEAAPLPYHGSGHIHALTGANALLKIPVGVSGLAAGSQAEAVVFRGVP